MYIVAKTQVNFSRLQQVVKSIKPSDELPTHHQFMSILFPYSAYFFETLASTGYGLITEFHEYTLLTINKRDFELLKKAVDDPQVLEILKRVT